MFRRKRRTSDLQAEIEAHLQLEEDCLRNEGLSAEAAHGAARRAFGNRTARQEEYYASGRAMWCEHLRRDVVLAFRSFGRERSFAAFAIVLIGLGAGLTAAMFALYSGVALRKIAVPDPDSLINIVALRDGRNSAVRYSMFKRLRDTFDLADSMIGWNGTLFPVTHAGQTQVLAMQYVAGDLGGTMGVRPILGRLFTSSEKDPVAIISEAYWQRIGGDPAIVGKVFRAGPVALTVVGVVPAASLEMIRFHQADILIPFDVGLTLESVPPERINRYSMDITARLKPGVTHHQAQQQLDSLWPRLIRETAAGQEEEWTRVAGGQGRVLTGSHGRLFSDESLPQVALTLLLLASLVSLMMCTNLAGVLLSRSLAKEKEYGLRLALGAKWRHLVRYALVEILILACAGSGVAVLLAQWVTELCLRALANDGGIAADYGVKVDGRVIGFGVLISVTAAVAAQLIPLLRISAIRVADSIKPGMRTMSARLGGRKTVLVVQVAASLALVSGSLLFVRTLESLTRLDTGFDAKNIVAVRLAPKVPWSRAEPAYFHELLRRVRTTAGVRAAGLTDRIPMEMDGEMSTPIAPVSGASTITDRGCVWPGYFDVLRIPLLAGRDIRASDTNALIVTRTLAETLVPEGAPVGRQVRLGKAPRDELFEVVGVIGDVRFRSPRQSNLSMAFAPCHHVWKPPQTSYAMGLLIRADAGMPEVETALRQHVEAMGKQAVLQTLPLARLISKSIRSERTISGIATGFGAFTLLLTCVGVYALIDLTVRLRRRELGIRMALGAGEMNVLGLVLSGVGRILAIGTVAGLSLTYVLFRAYRAYLYGVSDVEPWLIAGSVGLVALFTLIAAVIPAWRAVKTEPAAVLQSGV